MFEWIRVKQSNKTAGEIADRHYSRQTPGSKSFMPPGRQLIFVTLDTTALIGFSYPYSQYVHRKYYPDSWLCTIFRNEGNHLSSDLIKDAIIKAKQLWPFPPDGIITYVDKSKVKPKKDFGYCFKIVGFEPEFTVKNTLLLLHLTADKLKNLN